MHSDEFAPRLPKPVPVKLGEQKGELLLDLDGLFQVYSIQYVATPPKQVEKYLQRSGKPALVIFTKDQQTKRVSLDGAQKKSKTAVQHNWISKLPGSLSELKKHTRSALNKIRPLYHRIRETDELIDRLVARLYGLTDEEAARLWASPLS